MSCKPKAKSLRAADGMELMSRFAKQSGLRMVDGGEQPPVPGGNGLVSGASMLGSGTFNMATPRIGMRDGGELRLQAGGGLETGGHRGMFDSIGEMLPDFGFMRDEHVPGATTQWTQAPRVDYQRPQVSVAPAQPAAPVQPTSMPAAPVQPATPSGYGARQGFGYTAPAQPAAPAAPTLRPNSFGDNTSFNSSFNPNRANHGNVSMQEWSAPGRSNGNPSAQDMGAANGFAQRDAVKARAAQGGVNPNTISSRPTGTAYAPGLRDGGDLRTGQGGAVPGTGSGDKIPAKYEPGEFVVSNDMLDAQPELRGHLRGLREEVLAAKGMTPEMADAKAVSGKGLRAVNAFGDFYDDMGEPLGQRAAAPGVAAPPAATPAPAAAPNSGPPKPPGGYRTGQKLAGALRGTMGRAVPVLAGGYELATGMDEGDGWKMAKGAGDMVAGAALATPAAPIAAGYLGLRGAYEGAKALAPMVSDYFMKDRDAEVAKMLGPKAAPGMATPKATTSLNFDDANAAKLKAFATANPAEGPAKLNDTRNIDNEAGTMEVFTKANSDKAGWTTVSTPEAKAKRLREADDWKQEQADNAAQHRADMDRQTAYFKKANSAGANKYAGLPHKTAAAMRVADAQAASAMATSQLQANTSLRTTGMNNETSLMGNKMTNAFNMRKFQVEQGNKDREYALDVAKYGTDTADKNRAAAESSAKAHNDRMERMWRTKDGDGKDVADTNKIAAYTQNVENTLPDMVDALVKTGTPAALAKAKDIQTRGKAALDDSDHAALRQMQMRQDRLEGTHGAMFGSTHKKSASLLGYDQKAGTSANDGNYYFANGSMAPAKHMAYDEPGNFMLPDWLKRSDDTLTRGLRAE